MILSQKYFLIPVLLVSLIFVSSGLSEVAAGEKLQVMTYNIRYGSNRPPNSWPERLPVMQELLKQFSPDLIGMQEALYFQIKDLANAFPGYRWIGLGRNGGSHSEFMAVFYRTDRLEPLEFDHFWLSDYPNIVGSTTWGNSNRRMVTWVRFLDRKTKKQFYYVNTHLDHRIEKARVLSARLILKKIQNFQPGLPIILGGDFNASAENSAPYSILVSKGPFQDAWKSAEVRKGEELNTFNGFKEGPHAGGNRIDWILTRGAIRIYSAQVIDFKKDGQYPSDHFPVMVQLEILTERSGIRFQAHRGSVEEAPENTLAAYKHAWDVPGAVPEVDVRTSREGEFICLHDETLARTTNISGRLAHVRVSELPLNEIRKWDAGVKFDQKFSGEKVPLLREVFQEMVKHPRAEIYLDIKDDSKMAQLKDLIEEFGLGEKVIFVNGDQKKLIAFRKFFPGARTMTWLSGTPRQIKNRFEALGQTGFEGISQLQFHLKVKSNQPELEYAIEPEYLIYALSRLQESGVNLQLRPFEFDPGSLSNLLKLGIRWFVTDAPGHFYQVLSKAAGEQN